MTVDYVNNTNQRTPCVLVLDASYSMGAKTSSGKSRIEELNEGIKELENALKSDTTALTRVQLSVVAVGGPTQSAEMLMDWTDASNFTAFELSPGGSTPLAEGLNIALQLIETSKENLRSNGISYTRPWMIVISDGEPTSSNSSWADAISATQNAVADRKVEIFAIAVEGASEQKLNDIANRPCAKLSGMKFKELFVWLSDSLSAVTHSRPGEEISLPETDPWRSVGL